MNTETYKNLKELKDLVVQLNGIKHKIGEIYEIIHYNDEEYLLLTPPSLRTMELDRGMLVHVYTATVIKLLDILSKIVPSYIAFWGYPREKETWEKPMEIKLNLGAKT